MHINKHGVQLCTMCNTVDSVKGNISVTDCMPLSSLHQAIIINSAVQ